MSQYGLWIDECSQEESKQNDINAFIETMNICVSKEKAKSGAKNTNRFLVHWFGLLAKNRFLIKKFLFKFPFNYKTTLNK